MSRDFINDFNHEGWCDTQSKMPSSCNCIISYPLEVIDDQDSIIKKLEQENKHLREALGWAVNTAYYWVDNTGDLQRCVELDYKYDLKIDKTSREE